MIPEAETQFEQSIVDHVRDYGCHINYVFDREVDQPAFAYSVGFPKTAGQPEVIVFGLPQKVMHFMINETLYQCVNGLRLEDWTEITGLLEGHRCIARAIPAERITREYFNSALWYFRTTTGEVLTEAVQLVWPSAQNGLFPWDEGCADDVRDLQPPLYRTGLNS